MTEQYDGIASEYQRTKESPLRRHVEAYSFFNMVGDVAGLRVLDLACGEGFYTRLLKKAGAEVVVGVDISTEMIALADAEEEREPLGIDYRCSDVATLPDLGEFDLVTAAYLLHYAPDLQSLQTMCKRIARQLRSGGRLVCINENPEQTVADYAGYTQYGFNKSVKEPRGLSSPITYAMVSGRSIIRFDAYYYTRANYDTALLDAGFTQVVWHPLQLSPDALAECDADYWNEYLNNQPVVGLECQR